MMGVWFLSNAFGNKLAGWAAGFFSTMPLQSLFGVVAAILVVSAVLMFGLIRPMRSLMAEGK
jgi:dipeptide/tripeptide permease